MNLKTALDSLLRRATLPSRPCHPPFAALRRFQGVAEGGGPDTAVLSGRQTLPWQTQNHDQSRNTYAPPRPETRAAGSGGTCFKCGMGGHWAKDCQQPSSAFAAAEDGQAPPEKACPCGKGSCLILTAKTERNRGRQFFKCPVKEENGGCGYFEWCDKSTGNSTFAEEKSYKNGALERPANQGTSGLAETWNEYDIKGISSRNSGYGAAQKFESTDSKGYGSRSSSSSCFKCGGEDHWARDCPTTMPSSYVTGTASGKTSFSSNTCYKCGESGHWAKDCSQGQSTNVRNW